MLESHQAGDSADPAHRIGVIDELRSRLAAEIHDSRRRAILILDAYGFSDQEIGEIVGATARSVDSFPLPSPTSPGGSAS